MKITFKFVSVLFILFSCSTNSEKSTSSNSPQQPQKDKEINKNNILSETPNSELNIIASFLGGNQPKNMADFSSAFNSLEWKNHQNLMHVAWSKAVKEKITPMREWSKIQKIEKKTDTLFYPFSGADFLHVYSAHNDYSSYFLFGLEPVGEIPSKANILNASNTQNILSTIYKSVDENLSQSYFHTIYMAVEFNNPILKGTIPVFLFFMNKMDVQITSIQPVKYDENGNIIKENQFTKGVRIGFMDNGQQKELYYFSADISNKGMNNSKGLKEMISKISKNSTTMMKSASYLCHMPDFTTIRDLIVANTYSIMQDDTGVPYRFFEPSKWNFRHYGSYTQPIALFSGRGQVDLRNAVKGIEKPISFRYGYNDPPNIMIATRK
jgi:hypothetical protein